MRKQALANSAYWLISQAKAHTDASSDTTTSHADRPIQIYLWMRELSENWSYGGKLRTVTPWKYNHYIWLRLVFQSLLSFRRLFARRNSIVKECTNLLKQKNAGHKAAHIPCSLVRRVNFPCQSQRTVWLWLTWCDILCYFQMPFCFLFVCCCCCFLFLLFFSLLSICIILTTNYVVSWWRHNWQSRGHRCTVSPWLFVLVISNKNQLAFPGQFFFLFLFSVLH